MKSTHKSEVVKVELKPHPNADSLSLVSIFGYQVVVNTKMWEGIDKGVYLVPDSVVDVRGPEFSFLADPKKPEDFLKRIKVIKLRNAVSMGLLIPAPADSNIGDDLAEFYGITRYEPEFQGSTGGDCVAGPSFTFSPSKYDIDSFHRYLDLFEEGELVNVTEKIHGANARFSYMDGQQYCGSRTQWKKESKSDIWWRAYYNTPGIKAFCENNEGLILWGEVYGQVQNLKYGLKDVDFVAFDVFDVLAGRFLNVVEFENITSTFEVPRVPIIAQYWPLDKKAVLELAEGQSLIADHVREGCVIKPMEERWTEEVGRLALKIVGNGYYALK